MKKPFEYNPIQPVERAGGAKSMATNDLLAEDRKWAKFWGNTPEADEKTNAPHTQVRRYQADVILKVARRFKHATGRASNWHPRRYGKTDPQGAQALTGFPRGTTRGIYGTTRSIHGTARA